MCCPVGYTCMRPRGGRPGEMQCVGIADGTAPAMECEEPCLMVDCLPGCDLVGSDENGCGGTCECEETTTTSQIGSAFCSYPMWTIPETGDPNGRCDWDSCPKVIDSACDDIYGVFQGEQCTVHCADGTPGSETYTCSSDGTHFGYTWELTSAPLTCGEEKPVMPCTGEQGDHMCTCDSGLKYATYVGEVPEVPTEMPVVYGRRKMAIRGQEMYCGRANSCLYEQEVEPGFAGPIENYYDCLHLDSFESYEVTTYFPMNGELMSEEGSEVYCNEYTFHCGEAPVVLCESVVCGCQPGYTTLQEIDEDGCVTSCSCEPIEIPTSCESCVAQDMVWSTVFRGGCLTECAADVGCYTDVDACNTLNEITELCGSQETCSSCVEEDCYWNEVSGNCEVGVDMFFFNSIPGISQGQQCSGDEEPTFCCFGMTIECLACRLGVDEEEYCDQQGAVPWLCDTEPSEEPCEVLACMEGCDVINQDENGCGGECVCPNCPICDMCPDGMTSTDEIDENGCVMCGCVTDDSTEVMGCCYQYQMHSGGVAHYELHELHEGNLEALVSSNDCPVAELMGGATRFVEGLCTEFEGFAPEETEAPTETTPSHKVKTNMKFSGVHSGNFANVKASLEKVVAEALGIPKEKVSMVLVSSRRRRLQEDATVETTVEAEDVQEANNLSGAIAADNFHDDVSTGIDQEKQTNTHLQDVVVREIEQPIVEEIPITVSSSEPTRSQVANDNLETNVTEKNDDDDNMMLYVIIGAGAVVVILLGVVCYMCNQKQPDTVIVMQEQSPQEVKRGPAVSMTQFGPTPMQPSMPAAVNVGGAAFEGEGTRIQIEGESGTGGRTVVDL